MSGVTYDVRAGSDIPSFTIFTFLFTHTISSLDVVDRSNVAVALWWSIRRESEGMGFDEGLVRRLFFIVIFIYFYSRIMLNISYLQCSDNRLLLLQQERFFTAGYH